MMRVDVWSPFLIQFTQPSLPPINLDVACLRQCIHPDASILLQYPIPTHAFIAFRPSHYCDLIICAPNCIIIANHV
jgi:hypothetical protein